MVLKRVEVQPLTKETFKPYGYFLAKRKENPEVVSEQFTMWVHEGRLEVDGEFFVGVSDLLKRPLRFASMERHLKSMELLLPLNGSMLLAMAPHQSLDDPDEEPKVDQVEVFEVKAGQAVIFNKGPWHWTPFPMDDVVTILVALRDGTLEEGDVIIKPLPEETVVEVVVPVEQ